jgi:hypothetical protein
MRAPTYPRLAATEQVITEARLGHDTAVLTDRRVIVAGRHLEQSLPLGHIALLRVKFERPARNFVAAFVLIIVAVGLLAIASPVRTFLLDSSVSLEPAASQERANPNGAQQGLAQALQRIVRTVASAARILPWVGWLLLVVAVVELFIGFLGRTEVSVAAGGSEVFFSRRGNDSALQEFIAEVGRHLPAPAGSDSLTAATIPFPAPERS